MPRFRFALDPLLELRRREEDVLARQVGALERERAQIEAQLRQRQAEIAEGRTAIRASLIGALDVTALRQQASSTLAVDRLARITVLQLAAHAQRIEKAREALVEGAKRRRAIELVRERRLAEWRQADDRRETAFLDELSTNRARRSAGDGECEA